MHPPCIALNVDQHIEFTQAVDVKWKYVVRFPACAFLSICKLLLLKRVTVFLMKCSVSVFSFVLKSLCVILCFSLRLLFILLGDKNVFLL